MPAKREEVYTQKSFNCSKSAHEAISVIIGLNSRIGGPAIRTQTEAIEYALLETAKIIEKEYNSRIEVY